MGLTKGFEKIKKFIYRRRTQQREAWDAVALRRGGFAHHGGYRRWRWYPPTIDVVVGEVAVHGDVEMVQAGQASVPYTRVRANYLLSVGPSFKVKRTMFGGTIGKSLGFEDVELGDDPDFDHAFFVRSAHPEATRHAWHGVDKKLFLGLGEGHVTSNGQSVKLLFYDVVRKEDVLEGCIDAVAELASYGSSWLAPVRGVPEAIWTPPQGPWDERSTPCARVEHRGATVWIHPKVVDLGLRACASAVATDDGPPFRFESDEKGLPLVQSELPPGTLGHSVTEKLALVGRATIAREGRQINVTLLDELTSGRLAVAAELAATLSLGAAVGAYR